MNEWSSRRKNIYLAVVVLFLSSVSFYIFWVFWYTAPTCTDGIKNGDETGVDCGGSCALVCPASTLRPIISWDPRLFEVSPGIWSALIYVENPNIDTEASYFPYTFTLYGDDNNVVAKRTGATILPKNRTVGVFEGGISVPEDTKPKRATFDMGNIVWRKNSATEPDIAITHSPLLKLDTTPRVEAVVKNNDIQNLRNIELVATIFDGADNAIAASRTFIEELKAGESANVFFTWQKPFDLGVKACEKPSNIILAMDRSGSMASLGSNPPEPLTSVKDAASNFTSLLGKGDSVGVVTFATDATDDSSLSNDFTRTKSIISNISIGQTGTQFTNILGALLKSNEEFSTLGPTDSELVLILLTDGVANKPSDPKGKTEADDITYAENEALKAANTIKGQNVSIYTIGLGKDIHTDFLKQIASSPDKFFQAPSTSTLASIYNQISNSICKEVPSRIEITYKIYGSDIK